MTPHYCAEFNSDLTRGQILRWTCITLGAVLIVASKRAVGWAEARTLGACAAAVARVIAAAALAVVAGDLVLRAVSYSGPQRLPVLGHYEPDSEGDPLLIYRPVPSHETRKMAGDKPLYFYVDGNDWRRRSPDDVVDFRRPTILFTGESIASGYGLNYEETYPYLVGQALGVQVVNVAVQGYGNDGAYVRLHEALPRFEHPIATVTLIAPMALERNAWADRQHLVVRDDGSSWVEPVRDETSFVARSPLVHLASSVFFSQEGLRRARAYIAATARETRERDAYPLFLVTSFLFQCMADETGAPTIERTVLHDLNVDDVRVDLPFRLFDGVVMHPNAQGQAMLAAAVVDALRKQHIGPAASR